LCTFAVSFHSLVITFAPPPSAPRPVPPTSNYFRRPWAPGLSPPKSGPESSTYVYVESEPAAFNNNIQIQMKQWPGCYSVSGHAVVQLFEKNEKIDEVAGIGL